MRFVIIGRAGQGVRTFSRVLARAGSLAGFYSQSYSEISGDTVAGFVRFSKDPIAEKGVIEDPEIYVIFDDDLFEFKNASDGKIVVVNAQEKISSPWIKRKKLKIYWVDATGIGQMHIKRPYPNTAMLGVILKPFTKLSMKNMKLAIESDIKFKSKENQLCVEDGYKNAR